MSFILEYVWIGGAAVDFDVRSKSRVHKTQPMSIKEVPDWQFDGSSTGQNLGETLGAGTEVTLKPVKLYKDPLYKNHIIVLCECVIIGNLGEVIYPVDSEIISGFNTRRYASYVTAKIKSHDFWFGLEQEYVFTEIDASGRELPVGLIEYMKNASETEIHRSYCGTTFPNAKLKNLSVEHLHLAKEAGIAICGINSEVLLSQFEFQIGPVDLLTVCDDLIVARFFLIRLACDKGLRVSFEPKPVPGDHNGSGCHINVSTEAMRSTNGIKDILVAINNLRGNHPSIFQFYGKGNEKRLTGKNETGSMGSFSYGVGTRNTSIRIPYNVNRDKAGYFEDRRPAANIDPYVAVSKLALATLGLE